jgi:dTDP-L-rhamnose 4-epimerase
VTEDGRQMRNFVHVSDVAAANIAAIDRSGAFRAYNVASTEAHTVGEMAEALAAAFGVERGSNAWPEITGRYRLGDVRHVFASAMRAADELGFVAEVPFAEGMASFAHAQLRDPVTSTLVLRQRATR